MTFDLKNIEKTDIITKEVVLEKLKLLFPDKDVSKIDQFPEITQIEIPGYTYLEDECFIKRDFNNNVIQMFPNIKLVVNLNKVLNVGNYCFYNCKLLSNTNDIFFCIHIGDYGFYNTNVKFKDLIGFNEIGKHAFENCTGLSDIKIDTLSEYCFANSSIKKVTLPNDIKIPDHCFDNCHIEYNYV